MRAATSHTTAALRAFARIYAGWALSQDFYRADLHRTALGAPDLTASPDRADALVWALTALMLERGPAAPRLRVL